VVSGQVDHDAVLGGPFPQGDHRRDETEADDEVALPMAGRLLVLSLGGAFVDHHHVSNARAGPIVVVPPPVLADPLPGAQPGRVAFVQPGAVSGQQGAVDRFVADPHPGIVRVGLAQPAADLLRRPVPVKLALL
jgi:hypothetical protein